MEDITGSCGKALKGPALSLTSDSLQKKKAQLSHLDSVSAPVCLSISAGRGPFISWSPAISNHHQTRPLDQPALEITIATLFYLSPPAAFTALNKDKLQGIMVVGHNKAQMHTYITAQTGKEIASTQQQSCVLKGQCTLKLRNSLFAPNCPKHVHCHEKV